MARTGIMGGYVHPHNHPHTQLKKSGIPHTHTHTQSMRGFSVKTGTSLGNTHRGRFICHLQWYYNQHKNECKGLDEVGATVHIYKSHYSHKLIAPRTKTILGDEHKGRKRQDCGSYWKTPLGVVDYSHVWTIGGGLQSEGRVDTRGNKDRSM